MKKFYIPTSTLNFNNILSSESISPLAFYEKRGFGYSRWATIPENPFNNAIVLFDKLCCFERPLSDIEDHPLLIEIFLDEVQLKQLEGFWISDHTIYFTPRTTRFLFFNETDRTIALSMSESSLETKLIRLYIRQIQTIQKPTEYFKPILINEPSVLNELEIEKDIRINKMKGMLYGYYIGSLLSSDIDSVKYMNALREIHNIFAAILSSIDKLPTAYQNEKLEVLFDFLNEQNTDYRYLFELINSSEIDAKIKTKRIWAWMSSKRGSLQNEDKSIWLSYIASDKDEKENQAITWIKSKIDNAQRKMYAKRQLLLPDKEEIIVVDNKLSVLKNTNLGDELENHLCVSWFNETLSDKNTNGKISTYKEELAKNLTLKAREIYQESWEGSQTRVFLNDLRRHITGGEFIHEWNNGVLSSIAAVLVAGDDWEKMYVYMQNKEMTDYKLAFAFYGTLNGFANLTRDFTDFLYDQDKNYVWSLYKEFYGQLVGMDIPERVNDISSIPVNCTITELNNTKNDECIENESLKDKVKAIIKAHSRIKLSEKDITTIDQALDQTIDEVSFINMIYNEMDNMNKGIFPCLQKELYPDWKPIKTKRNSKKKKDVPKEPNLFGSIDDDSSKLFVSKADGEIVQRSIINDNQADKVIENCPILPTNIKRQVVTLFKDFQKSYQIGYYYKNQDRYKRNNSDVIDHFIKWCLSRKNESHINWSPENSKLMDELKAYLMNTYGE